MKDVVAKIKYSARSPFWRETVRAPTKSSRKAFSTRSSLIGLRETTSTAALPPSLLTTSFILSRRAVTMLSRFAPRAFTAPIRSNAARLTPALRTVTTDAASSHVEKSDVPEVHHKIRGRSSCSA